MVAKLPALLDPAGRASLLADRAAAYADVARTNIDREFPNDVHHLMTAPGDWPGRPRDRTPVFYGSYDWHSCVEMFWVLVRLLRQVPTALANNGADIRELLDARLGVWQLAEEARFVASSDGRRQRPYGWGWALCLAGELAAWDDPQARRWSELFSPLTEVLVQGYLQWLPSAGYAVRSGLHPNSAFALGRALPVAELLAARGRPELREAVLAAARRWFAADRDYPTAFEPSGSDFLSPALAEAELMTQVLRPAEFASWWESFLPGVAAGGAAALAAPVVVSDASDGQTAHLHGLNMSRAWCWRRIAETLGPAHPDTAVAGRRAQTHAAAALPHVVGSDYMVEHWLVAYALLLLG